MTINEKKQLKEYITSLVRESLGEIDMPKWHNELYGINDEDFEEGGQYDDAVDDEFDDYPTRDDINNYWRERHFEGQGEPEHKKDNDQEDKQIAGIDELRQLTENMAREAVSNVLMEKKKKDKRKNKKEKTSSKDKTVVSQLNADGTNAAHYYYKLYGVENGTEAQKAAARSKGYKKAKGKKNDTGVPYKFSSKERNRLSSLLTDRK
jgi:hypothetical protein